MIIIDNLSGAPKRDPVVPNTEKGYSYRGYSKNIEKTFEQSTMTLKKSVMNPEINRSTRILVSHITQSKTVTSAILTPPKIGCVTVLWSSAKSIQY